MILLLATEFVSEVSLINKILKYDENIFSENAKNLCNPLNDPEEKATTCSMACIDGDFFSSER